MHCHLGKERPRNTAPGTSEAIHQAKREDAKLIVIDPVKTYFAEMADIWLQIKPGHDGQLAMAMLHEIFAKGFCDDGFVKKYCIGFDALKSAARAYPAERVAARLRLDTDKIGQAARLYAATMKSHTLSGCWWCSPAIRRQP
ncbi:MAG: molybdopterin-dependent oxidoreductase [Deltaproteobacteria bacterium]|nr:molybdopterin-dependent oxidoreductase [Deltaproteobacteria bacterium]